MIADILDREAERTIKLQDYAQRLARTYSGTIDPAVKPAEYRDELLKSAGVTEFNGFATDRPFDEKGRPIMSYNEYIMYLDKTEPLLTSEETARLQKLAESAQLLDRSRSALEWFCRAVHGPTVGKAQAEHRF